MADIRESRFVAEGLIQLPMNRFGCVLNRGIAWTFSFLALSILLAWGICGSLGGRMVWIPFRLPGDLISHYLIIFLGAGPAVVLVSKLSSKLLRLFKGRSVPPASRVVLAFIRCYYAPLNLARGFMAYSIFGLALVAYLNLKPAIPIMNPDLNDAILWNQDQWISGFGAVYHAIFEFNRPWLTRMLDDIYFQVFNLVGLTLAVLYQTPPLFWRFSAALPLSFVLSLPVSIMVPSLGPAFFRPELFSFTKGTASARVMAALWDQYQAFKVDPVHTPVQVGNGIVAMPSLHITMVFLSVVFLQKAVPRLKGVLWGFLVLFFVSTVYLGWHYILDGLAGILLGWVVLSICKRWFPDEEIKEGS
jgi:membrane-associated phospholipid phosphatase